MENKTFSPADYYRRKRPEYFSDSESSYESELPQEVFAFELEKITTNQKQDEFEMFCRKVAEKTICPNLIPQTGPTGGGDGKTDSETYPLSTKISDRWFIPENGWSNNEKWAFAISAKKVWKEKLKKDVKSIISTGRDYTRIYFMTNQTISSKQRKKAEDDLKTEHTCEIVILDGKWLIDKIYTNDYISLAVNSLNLSQTFGSKKLNVGKNDASRIQRLEELERNIGHPNRYSELDFQLVEDCLQSAILSRMLEKPKDEVLGKFDRALRFAQRNKNNKQVLRIHYQRAWTSIYWFEDYKFAIKDYRIVKIEVESTTEIDHLELLINLFNSLSAVEAQGKELLLNQIDIPEEKEFIIAALKRFAVDKNKGTSALVARTQLVLLNMIDEILNKNEDTVFENLFDILLESERYLDYPFYRYKQTIETVGQYVPNSAGYDKLINLLAKLTGKYSSDVAVAKTFLTRGTDKLEGKLYKESVVFFGKAVLKFSKAESNDGMYLAFRGLADAYFNLGLLWASNNCLLSSASIAFKSWHKSGLFTRRMADSIELLTKNELLLGRIPATLTWYELYRIVASQIISDPHDDVPIHYLIDACFSCRLLNSEHTEEISMLPSILSDDFLWQTKMTAMYILGYNEELAKDFVGTDIKSNKDVEEYFRKIASQPFKNQMIYETDFFSGNILSIRSIILGCKFRISFVQDLKLVLIGETIMAFLESFLSTSLEEVIPNTEEISIALSDGGKMKISGSEKQSSEYEVQVDSNNWESLDRQIVWNSMIELISMFFANNFVVDDHEKYLQKIFLNEEVSERLALTLEYSRLMRGVVGEPKFLFKNWINDETIKFDNQRQHPLSYKENETNAPGTSSLFKPEAANHAQRQVSTVIDDKLWNIAGWQSFGYFNDENGLSVFLGFQDRDAAIRIFENWNTRFGLTDINEEIKITIVRGVDKSNPFKYRVIISSNIDEDNFPKDKLLIIGARFHELDPQSSRNLDTLLNLVNLHKSYRLCPIQTVDERRALPVATPGIFKKNLFVKNAWEIGIHDFERVAIRKHDKPIIPENIIDAPVLNILKDLKE